MGIKQSVDEIRVATNGVELIKRLDTEKFPAPAIVFEVTSNRTDGVVVRLEEAIPDEIGDDDIGFHPEYGQEHWTIEGNSIVFEYDLDPHESYSTLYAMRADVAEIRPVLEAEPSVDIDTDSAEKNTSNPLEEQIPDVEAATDIGDVARSDGGSTNDIIPTAQEEAVERVEGERANTDNRTRSRDESSDTSDASTIVDALVSDVRAGKVSEEQLDELREILHPPKRSLDARITKVQSDVSDLLAYTDVLESFLDENGTGQQLIEDFKARLDKSEAEVREVKASVAANDKQIDSLDEFGSELQGEVDEFRDEIDTVHDTLEHLEAKLEDIENHVPEENISASLDEMSEEIDSLKDWQNQIRSVFGEQSQPGTVTK